LAGLGTWVDGGFGYVPTTSGVLIFRPAVVVSHESSGMLVTCKTGAAYSYCLPLKKVSVRAVEERSNRTDGMTRSELAQNHMDMVTAQADHRELLVSICPPPPHGPFQL
jgi:hypothetical protein